MGCAPQYIIKHNVGLLNLAAELANVSRPSPTAVSCLYITEKLISLHIMQLIEF